MLKAIAVIGEGITEKYYIESLKGLSRFNILPQELGRKASSLSQLEKTINNAIKAGYDEVYCLIDMDTKKEGKSRISYEKLKIKYHDKIYGKKKDGIQCRVIFIENERCIELWFLYHFTKTATTREFTSYNELETALRKHRPDYEKTDQYFRKCGGIHQNLTGKNSPQGSLSQALKNSIRSTQSRDEDKRPYTYSEMHLLIEGLQIPIK